VYQRYGASNSRHEEDRDTCSGTHGERAGSATAGQRRMKSKDLKRKQKRQPGGSLEPVGSDLWTVEYEYQCRVWATAVEAPTREAAMERVRRENPHHIEIRECWPNVADHRPRATRLQNGTEASTRGSVHPLCSAEYGLSRLGIISHLARNNIKRTCNSLVRADKPPQKYQDIDYDGYDASDIGHEKQSSECCHISTFCFGYGSCGLPPNDGTERCGRPKTPELAKNVARPHSLSATSGKAGGLSEAERLKAAWPFGQ
jgi:hypothetical protein